MKVYLEHRLRDEVLSDRLSILVTTLVSFLRALPLFISARPRTTLRVLCLIAFDTHHVLRNLSRLPWSKIKLLAAMLDFGACANAKFDSKPYDSREQQATERILNEAGIEVLRLEYLRRLGILEGRRPCIGGDQTHLQQVRFYREAVIRLSLGLVTTIAGDKNCLVAGIRATYTDDVLDVLFRVVMQCQIIDDVLDYPKDAVAGLPSFLTASESFADSIRNARSMTKWYACASDLPSSAETLPFRIALLFVSLGARLVIFLRALQAEVRTVTGRVHSNSKDRAPQAALPRGR